MTEHHRARLPAGLPNTSIDSLRELALAIVARALCDDDDAFLVGPDEAWGSYLMRVVGLDDDEILQLKVRYCLNRLDPGRFDGRRINNARFPDKDLRAEVTEWQTWASPAR